MDNKQLTDEAEGMTQFEFELRRAEIEIRRRQVELPIELASLGLRGTLTGALGGLVLLIILALIGAFVEKAQITGTHLCVLLGIICAGVVFYGAFVFQRSFQIAVDRSTGVTAGTSAREPDRKMAEPESAPDRGR